ncbi:MAG: Hint domain-containing protein [Marinibacterium sp.]
MSWVALVTQDGGWFLPRGLGAGLAAPDLVATDPQACLMRGTLMIETRLPPINKPAPLLVYDGPGPRPVHMSLQAMPGGGLTFFLDQNGNLKHGSINASDNGRADVLRVSYCWDVPAGWGRIVLDRPGEHVTQAIVLDRPDPLPVADLRALSHGRASLAAEVLFAAVSNWAEPIGPMPSLMTDTPICTPSGYRRAADIRPGDRVRTACGRDVNVLHRVERLVPAIGSFRPLTLRPPFFGLKQDIHVAPFQRALLGGSMVEYLFGTECVLAPAEQLGPSRAPQAALDGIPPLLRYVQFILPRNEALLAAGMAIESLNIGRIRRKPGRLAASLLAGCDRALLPEHAQPRHRVLKPFETTVLAECRAA